MTGQLSPVVPAAALVLCAGLGASGWWILRTEPIVQARLAHDETLHRSPPRVSVVARLLRLLGSRFGPSVVRALGPRRMDQTRAKLDAAGNPGGWTAETWAERKAAFTVLAGLPALLLLLSGQVFFPLALVIGGWFWTDIVVAVALRRRQGALERGLPDFLDVLSVTVGAGLSFRQALERVSMATTGPLGEEVTLVLRQMSLGVSRRRALEEMRSRNRSPALAQFVTAMLQAEELGAPLAAALQEIATDMRRSTAQDARRRAARAAPRVSLIVTTVIMPGIILVLVVSLIIGSAAGPGLNDLLKGGP